MSIPKQTWIPAPDISPPPSPPAPHPLFHFLVSNMPFIQGTSKGYPSSPTLDSDPPHIIVSRTQPNQHTSNISTANSMAQATVISFLENCKSFLTGLPGSFARLLSVFSSVLVNV